MRESISYYTVLMPVVLMVGFIACGKLGTVEHEGTINTVVSVNTDQLDAYFVIECCKTALTSVATQTNTAPPTDSQIQDCANTPTPDIVTCSKTHTADLLSIVSQM